MTTSASGRNRRQPLEKAPRAFSRVVVANWKMNPSTLKEAKWLFLAVKNEASRRQRVETVIAAPFVYLAELHKLLAGARIELAAQDVFWAKEGTYTGEISPSMLLDVGVSHVIIGHSERRARGEDDAEVARKIAAAIKGGLTVVLCVGESARDASGRYLTVVEQQLRSACASVPKAALDSLLVAYEPIWAISDGSGKGQTARAEDAHEMAIFIRRVLTNMYTRPAAERARILYGGSVNEENAHALTEEGMVDGFLVGGASLKPQTFAAILTAANERRAQ